MVVMRNMNKLYLPAAVAFGLIVVGTIVQGRIVDRAFPLLGKPKPNPQLQQFADRLAKVPYRFGPWEGEDIEQTEEDRQQLVYARVTGSLSRVYTNRLTGQQVSLFIVCGKSQNVADHTPDQCFRAAGYSMLQSPVRYRHAIEDAATDVPLEVEFYTSVFQKQNPDQADERARVFWTWRSASEGWEAPKWPLLHYAGTPALYKLYLLSPVGSVLTDVTTDPAIEFCDAALPTINELLVPAEPSTAEAGTEADKTADTPEKPETGQENRPSEQPALREETPDEGDTP